MPILGRDQPVALAVALFVIAAVTHDPGKAGCWMPRSTLWLHRRSPMSFCGLRVPDW